VTFDFYKEIGFSLLIIGIVAVLLGAIIAWLAYDMNRHATGIQSLLAEMQARKEAEGQLVILKGQATQAAGYAPSLLSMLPEADSLVGFPREAASRARLYGLDFGFTFGESTKGSTTTPGTVAYVMSGKGLLGKWIDFIYAFEAGSPLLGVERAVFESSNGTAYEAKITGHVFSQ
jgi:hypothetical protein